MRVALQIAYDGSEFHGWQRQQQGVETVQASLEAALSQVANKPITLTCAGRTDTGVHALSQVVHFDSDADRNLNAWLRGGNALLPDSVSINSATAVDDSFDARHSATARRYVYLIYNQPRRHALFHGYMARFHQPLSESVMAEAGQMLLGENDFSAFRAANCQSRTPMRNVHHVVVTRAADMVLIDIAANAFLYHMVRNIVGALVDVGSGHRSLQWFAELFAGRDRTVGSKTAPARGLYLADVSYPQTYGLPPTGSVPHFFGLLPLDS